MKTSAHILVISILTLVSMGCAGSSPPGPYGERSGALGSTEPAAEQPIPSDVVDAAALPVDLMTCDDFFGADWDTPDLILLVQSTRGMVVLVQDGEMLCSGHLGQLGSRLAGLDLGPMASLGGSWSSGPSMGTGGNANVGAVGITDEHGYSNPLPASGSTASGINEDSNPLPASPAGSSASDDPTGDSNPLPANPSGSSSGTTEDSNPLPAHSDDPNQAFFFSAPTSD